MPSGTYEHKSNQGFQEGHKLQSGKRNSNYIDGRNSDKENDKRYRQEHKKEKAEYNKKYKRNAKQRNKEWGLTDEQFMTFWQIPCYYCGSKIETIGIDRRNNNEGYVFNNVVSCCTICNKAKLKMSEDKFINHCKKVAKFQLMGL